MDVLIGADCADLHYAIEEVRGGPGEPTARLTPLGWTCIGRPGSHQRKALQTNFASTYFVKDQSEIERLNGNLNRFWETDDAMTVRNDGIGASPVVRTEEKIALKTVENSMRYENNLYQVGIP